MFPIRENELPINMYPEAGQDLDFINAAFDNFFETVEQKETDQGTMLFSKVGRDADPFEGNDTEREEVARQMAAVKEVRDSEGRLLAPNGKVSNLPEHLWKAVRTPFFKRWFGDWELLGIDIEDIIGKDGQINYARARQIASGIISGSLTAANEQRQRAQVRGGRRNVEASVILTGNERSDPTPARGDGRFKGIQRQESILERYARQEGVLLDERSERNRFTASGRESRVYASDDNTVRKYTDPRSVNRGVTPLDHIDNITSFNAVFPETAYTVIGFAKGGDGKFKFVTSQPYITGRYATPAEIEEMMTDKGFARIDSETFENAEYVVRDLAPRNVIFNTESGQAFTVDANISRKHEQSDSYKVSASKVVDENSEPKIMYHGTNMDFTCTSQDLI